MEAAHDLSWHYVVGIVITFRPYKHVYLFAFVLLSIRDAYVHMQSLGYTVEILRGPWTCFDGSLYGILIVSDVEENIAAVEMDKVQIDIREKGLSVLIAADWYDEMSLLSSDFYDDNTHSTWFPITGGSHVFTVNQFLGRFGMQFGLQVFDGWFDITPNDRVRG